MAAATGAEAIAALNRFFLPWFGGAVLAGCAAFSFWGQSYLLIGLMLAWPLIDRRWQPPPFPRSPRNRFTWFALIAVAGGLLLWQPAQTAFAVSTLLMAALPEEWFFRAYFLASIGAGLRANVTTSVLFALTHALARDPLTGVLVFLPSLFYGWLYQRTQDLPLLVLTHALSNLVFVMFLADRVGGWW